jgi:DNA-binding CsgD family transcriptional regulator
MFVSELGPTIAKLQDAGVPMLQIAQRLGVAQATVHYHLRKLRAAPAGAAVPVHAVPNAVSAVRTRDLVAALLNDGVNRAEIARRIGVSKATVSYHARRLGAPIDDRCRRRYDWTAVQHYYDLGHSIRECAAAFGCTTSTFTDAVKRGDIVSRPHARPLNEVFAANTHRNRGGLKRRLIREGIKADCCEVCGLSEWLGQPLRMALHHINGDRLDNRIENLQLLCANCHSQTDTYGGRNGRRDPL